MAISVISQHFYEDETLQFVNCVISAELFTSAYEQFKIYIQGATGTAGQESHIETLNVSKVRGFNGGTPTTETVNEIQADTMSRAGFIFTATFKRLE